MDAFIPEERLTRRTWKMRSSQASLKNCIEETVAVTKFSPNFFQNRLAI